MTALLTEKITYGNQKAGTLEYIITPAAKFNQGKESGRQQFKV